MQVLCSEYNIRVKVRLDFKKAIKIYQLRSDYDPPDAEPEYQWRVPSRKQLVDRVHTLVDKLNIKYYGKKSEHRLNMIFTMPVEFRRQERPYAIGYIGFPTNSKGYDASFPSKIEPYHPLHIYPAAPTQENLWTPIDLNFYDPGHNKFGHLLENLWQGKKRHPNPKKTGKYVVDYPYGGYATDNFSSDPLPVKDSPEVIYWSLGLQPGCASYIHNTATRLDDIFMD